MRKIEFFRFFYLFLSFSLFIAPLPLSAIAQEITASISEMEADMLDQNPDTSYVYLGRNQSNIADLVWQLCDLDEDINSPLHKLHEHISNGFTIAEHDAVIEALAYAESLIDHNHKKLPREQAEKIIDVLNVIMD